MKGPVAIVGAGYVGLPLAEVFAGAGNRVVLVETNPEKVELVKRGESYIRDVPSEGLARLVESGAIEITTDYDALEEADAILIALQTPLTAQREPDLSIVLGAALDIAPRLQKGQLVVLESTTYPGTTRERLRPILESGSGLKAGEDFHLAFSPERVDPGREDWTTQNTPKIVGGLTPACTERAVELYSRALETVHPVSSPEAAELTKLLENIFRSVNIALVNELAQLCDRMQIDVWEVIGAAATKPFGFMSFQPGPGLGGHCMPIDPFYLTWKAREYDFYTEFIELAGKVNENMPYWCLGKIARALNANEKALKGSKVQILGVSYKADIDDTRESPALKMIELLQEAGADVSYHDPFVPRAARAGPDLELRSTRGGLGLRRDRHRPLGHRLRRPGRAGAARRRPAQRDRLERDRERQGLEAVIRIGHAGLGYWGPNLARNFGALADLRWLCDLSPELLAAAAKAHPQARTTADFEELLADPELDAVVIATPVVTHYELAKRALMAGKHVFVEKPQAQSSAEAEELLAIAEERNLVLMPGYLLLYHPAVSKLKELIDAGELGDILYLYGNRQNLGQFRSDENALWSIGSQDFSMILHLIGEEPSEAWARGESFLRKGIEDVVFSYLRFPSGIVAHTHVSWLDPHKMRKLTVVGRDKMAVFDDMEPDRKLTVYDKGPGRAAGERLAGSSRRHPHPEALDGGAAAPGVRALPRADRR